MTPLRCILLVLTTTLAATVVHAEVQGTFGSSMKPEDSGTQTIFNAEFTVRRNHRWLATDYKVNGEHIDIDDVEHNDRTFDYDDQVLTFSFAGLAPGSGLGGSVGAGYLFGWGDIEGPDGRVFEIGHGVEGFLSLAYSWRIIEFFGIDFGASGTGRWVTYAGDADGEYWSYNVSPILNPYFIVTLDAIDGGFKVYAGPLFEWGEVFMDHERDGFDEEIRLHNRDMWGVYGGAGLTLDFLYIGIRAEWLRDWTIKGQFGFSY